MCRYGQSRSVGANEYAVAGTIMPPINVVPPRYGLHLFDPSIQRVACHCIEQFCGAVHVLNSIARNIKC
jgi:hypothetical protein